MDETELLRLEGQGQKLGPRSVEHASPPAREKRLSRQPAILFFTLIQPMIWLVLFGQMFSRITTLGGPQTLQQFGGVSYLQFFMPAVMLAAWYGGLWPGLLATALGIAGGALLIPPTDPTFLDRAAIFLLASAVK